MQEQLTELVTVLRQEIEQYRRLLAVVRRERGRIVRGELAGVVEAVRKKEAITQELANLEAARAALLDRLREELGDPGSPFTLAQAAALAPAKHGQTLREIVIEFRGVVGLLMAANEVNRTLLDRSLDFVQGSLELFRTVATAPAYTSGGRFGEAARSATALNQTA